MGIIDDIRKNVWNVVKKGFQASESTWKWGYDLIKFSLTNSKTIERWLERTVKKAQEGFMGKIDNLNDFIGLIDKDTLRNVTKYVDIEDWIKLDDIVQGIDEEFELLMLDIPEYQPVKKSWYPQIDYSSRKYTIERRAYPNMDFYDEGKAQGYIYEKNGNEYYERHAELSYKDTVKIRENLSYFTEKKGFPMAFARDLNFTMFIGIRIRTGWTVHKLKTIEMWKKKPHKRWREVKIYYRGAEFMQFAEQIASTMPYISSALWYIKKEFEERTLRNFPIYENLAYKSSLNDGLIKANWDKIKEEFEREYD